MKVILTDDYNETLCLEVTKEQYKIIKYLYDKDFNIGDCNMTVIDELEFYEV